MAKGPTVTTDQKAIEIARSLIEIASTSGLEITITIPPKQDKEPAFEEVVEHDGLSIKDQKRTDLAWLQTYITENPNQLARLSSHYVAVYKERIVSIGDSYELVLIGASGSLGVIPDRILVVPVQVCGSESEEAWLQIKRELGIADS